MLCVERRGRQDPVWQQHGLPAQALSGHRWRVGRGRARARCWHARRLLELSWHDGGEGRLRLGVQMQKVPWVRHVAADPDGGQQYPGWPRGGAREGAQRRAWGTRRAVSGQRGDDDVCVVGDGEFGARVLKASRSLDPPPRQGSAAAVSVLLPLRRRDALPKPGSGSSHCAASTSPRLRWSPSSLLHMRGLYCFTPSHCHLFHPGHLTMCRHATVHVSTRREMPQAPAPPASPSLPPQADTSAYRIKIRKQHRTPSR